MEISHAQPSSMVTVEQVVGDAMLTEQRVDSAENRSNPSTPNIPQPHERTGLQFSKTKLCRHAQRGICILGNKCGYAHSADELLERPDLTKTRMCPRLKRGCKLGKNCKFAHALSELRNTDIWYKTVPCWHWQARGECRLGATCRHAHGEEELRVYQKQNAEIQAQMAMQGLAQPPPPMDYPQDSALYEAYEQQRGSGIPLTGMSRKRAAEHDLDAFQPMKQQAFQHNVMMVPMSQAMYVQPQTQQSAPLQVVTYPQGGSAHAVQQGGSYGYNQATNQWGYQQSPSAEASADYATTYTYSYEQPQQQAQYGSPTLYHSGTPQ